MASYFIANPTKTETDFLSHLNDIGVELPNRNQIDYCFNKHRGLNKVRYFEIWNGTNIDQIVNELTNFFKSLELSGSKRKTAYSKLYVFLKNDFIFDRKLFLKERAGKRPDKFPMSRYVGECRLTERNYRFRTGLVYLQLYKDLDQILPLHLEDSNFPTTNQRILRPFRDVLRALAPYPFKTKKLRDFITNNF